MIFHDLACPKAHIFSSNFIEISMLFQDPLLYTIFLGFMTTWCQNVRFWEPLGAQLGPKWQPNHPSGAKRTPFSQRRARRFADLLPGSFSKRSWQPFSWILIHFVIIFDRIRILLAVPEPNFLRDHVRDASRHHFCRFRMKFSIDIAWV